MDDVLKRVLAAEKEAGGIVSDAERKADAIAARARAEAKEFEEDFQKQTVIEASNLIRHAETEAQGEKENAVKAAQARIRLTMVELETRIGPAVDYVVGQLAFPFGNRG